MAASVNIDLGFMVHQQKLIYSTAVLKYRRHHIRSTLMMTINRFTEIATPTVIAAGSLNYAHSSSIIGAHDSCFPLYITLPFDLTGLRILCILFLELCPSGNHSTAVCFIKC